ncbi:M4 family metallopeptidase [Bdellovibrionota bacterium FG-2]
MVSFFKTSTLAVLIALFLPSLTVQASVRLFQAGKAPTLLSNDVKVTTPSSPTKKLNKGLVAQEILHFIDSRKELFGLSHVDAEVLELGRVHGDAKGYSLRFHQRYARVHVQGAELIALTDFAGNLLTLNSSLIAAPSISVQPSISRDQALALAIKSQQYSDAELGQDVHDGLLIVTPKGIPTLVWQFSLREHSTGGKAAQIQIYAQGARAGKVLKSISIGNEVAEATISIYDASVTFIMPNPIYKGVLVLENGKTTLAGYALISDEARFANTSFENVRDFYSNVFERNSYDNQGAEIVASVNSQRITMIDLLKQKQNAAWMGPWKMFMFGAGGDELAGFTAAVDVVGHEFTHAVVSSTSNLTYEKQSGALNEHVADVFGSMIQSYYDPSSEFHLIGETILRGEFKAKFRALRDMLNPHDGLSPQPATIGEIAPEFDTSCQPSGSNDNCGVHILSGIPNRVVGLTVQKLGWEPVRSLYYKVMTDRLRASSDFADYRDQTLDECAASLTQAQCEVIKDAFKTVGL